VQPFRAREGRARIAPLHRLGNVGEVRQAVPPLNDVSRPQCT
jgi:hypothetical protein